MVQTEDKTEHKPPNFEHKSPTGTSENTTDKLYNILNYRNLRDITLMLDTYNRNPSDSPITTLTHIHACYYRIYKLLQLLDLRSQRII